MRPMDNNELLSLPGLLDAAPAASPVGAFTPAMAVPGHAAGRRAAGPVPVGMPRPRGGWEGGYAVREQ
jgi:hypothetical protein